MSEEKHDLDDALMVRPKSAVAEKPQKTTTPGVSAPVDARGINYLAMNCVVPGLGSLLRGHKQTGAAQLGLAVVGLLLLFSWHWMLGPLLMFAAWVWSVGSGIKMLGEKPRSAWE